VHDSSFDRTPLPTPPMTDVDVTAALNPCSLCESPAR